MRKFLAIVGAVALLVIAAAGLLIGTAIKQVRRLDVESRAFVDHAVPAITGHWDGEQLAARAAPELQESLTPGQLAAVFARFARLGPLIAYDGATGVASKSYRLGSGVSAAYTAGAEYRNGSARLRIGLVERGGKWLITGFRVDPQDPVAAFALGRGGTLAGPVSTPPESADVAGPIGKALRVRKAILDSDFATASRVAADVLARSRLEDWRFYPFDAFFADVTYQCRSDFLERLTAWIGKDPNAALPSLFRAQCFISEAWAERGHGFASETQAAQFAAFAVYMKKALADSEAAVQLDANNPYSSHLKLQILHAYGFSPQMVEAFRTAIGRYPSYYALYLDFLDTLEPRWGGSVAALKAFVDQYAGDTPQYSPLRLLYLGLYRRLLTSAAVDCQRHQGSQEMAPCVAAGMGRSATPALEKQASAALHLYDHSDPYQFGLAIKNILFHMLTISGGDAFSGAILQLAATAMHSDTSLHPEKLSHNDYVIDEAVALSWEEKKFYDNALKKYNQAAADAEAQAFPNTEARDLAIGSIYEQLARVSGDGLHRYDDMIEYEKLAIAHGVLWDAHYVCFAYIKLKKYKDAVQACTVAIDATGSLAAHYWRAVAYRDSGNMDAALRDFKSVADSDNQLRGSAAIELSGIYFKQNDNRGALAVLNRYPYLYDPNRVARSDVAVAYNNRCYAYMQSSKPQEALKDCTKSLRYGSLPDAYRKHQELVRRLGYKRQL